MLTSNIRVKKLRFQSLLITFTSTDIQSKEAIMKNATLATLILAPTLFTSATADTTFGVGMGSMYNGLGLNFGRTTDTSLVYGSLGCMGFSSGGATTSNGDVTSQGNNSDANCGVGLGYINTSLFTGNKHGLGLNISYTYDTDDFLGGSEYHVMPSYNYFFKGIDKRGLNLGFGARTTVSDQATTTGLMLNLGYQF